MRLLRKEHEDDLHTALMMGRRIGVRGGRTTTGHDEQSDNVCEVTGR